MSCRIVKSGDRLTVLVKRKYHPRGIKTITAFAWRITSVFSLDELRKAENLREKNGEA